MTYSQQNNAALPAPTQHRALNHWHLLYSSVGYRVKSRDNRNRLQLYVYEVYNANLLIIRRRIRGTVRNRAKRLNTGA